MNAQEKSESPKINHLDPAEVHAFRAMFEHAEILTKEVEEFRKDVAIPSINELRYAGYHISVALVDQLDQPDKELVKATNHCRRAAYDAASAGISTALLLIDDLLADYQSIVISEVVDDWSTKKKQINKIREHIPTSRTKDEDKDRDFADQTAAFRDLKEIYWELHGVRDELNIKLNDKIKESRRFTMGIAITVALAITGMALSFALSP